MNWRFTKQLLKVLAILLLGIALYRTFTQDAFSTNVSADFLIWKTPEVSVAVFIISAFVLGLLIGLGMAVVDHFYMAKKMRELIDENRRITDTIPVTKEKPAPDVEEAIEEDEKEEQEASDDEEKAPEA